MASTIPDMYALPPEALEAMRNGEAPPAPAADAPAEGTPTEEAAEAPAEEASEGEAGEQQEQGQEQAPQGDSPNFKAMRTRLAQMERTLQDPAALAAYLRANGFDLVPLGATPAAAKATADAGNTPTPDAADPFAAFDEQTAGALRAALEAHIKPLADKLTAAEQREAVARQQADLVALEQEHPGLIGHVRAFDAALPDQAAIADPVVKHLTMLGNRLTDGSQHGALVKELLAKMDPAEARALIEPIAKGHAVEMIAARLPTAAKAKPAAVTLGGAVPARGNDQLPPIETMNAAEWAKLPQHVKDKYLG